jgi:hypothetical protein
VDALKNASKSPVRLFLHDTNSVGNPEQVEDKVNE